MTGGGGRWEEGKVGDGEVRGRGARGRDQICLLHSPIFPQLLGASDDWKEIMYRQIAKSRKRAKK